MKSNFWIYLFIMFIVTYLVRVAPLLIFRKKIKNRFVRSFLAYIPYAVLAAMTFPAVFFAVGSVPAATVGVVIAIGVALAGGSLFTVAISASAAVYIMLWIFAI